MPNRVTTTSLGILTVAGLSAATAMPAYAQQQRGAPMVGTIGQAEMARIPLSESRVETLERTIRQDMGRQNVAHHGAGHQNVNHQSMGRQRVVQQAPLRRDVRETTETIVGADGVETVVTTQYITAPGHSFVEHGAHGRPIAQGHHGYYPPAAGGAVFSREQWIAECRSRTDGLNDRNQKGGIIGGLLGAITGGIIGNRVSASERLGGSLIGAGVGGLAGLAIGALIDRGNRNDNDGYDCNAALDRYLSQYGHPDGRSRVIAGPGHGYGYGYSQGYAAPAAYPAQYGYAGGYYPGCGCQQQVTYIPVHYQQRQRVIVRETVREEVIPGKKRYIPGKVVRQPHPKPQPTKVVPAPSYKPQPVKVIKR